MADVAVSLQPGQQFPVSVIDQLTTVEIAAPLSNLDVSVSSSAQINSTVVGNAERLVTISGNAGSGNGSSGPSVKTVSVGSDAERLNLNSSQINLGDVVHVSSPATTWRSPVFQIRAQPVPDSNYYFNIDNGNYWSFNYYSDIGVTDTDIDFDVGYKLWAFLNNNYSGDFDVAYNGVTRVVTLSFKYEGSNYATVYADVGDISQTVTEIRSASAVDGNYYLVIDINKIGTDGAFVKMTLPNQSLNTSDTVTFGSVITSGTSNAGNPAQVTIDPLYGFNFLTNAGYGMSQNGAMSWDDTQGSLNLYNRGSLAAIRVLNDGTTQLGYYYGRNVIIYNSGNVQIPGTVQIQGGTLSSNGTHLYWNGTQIA